MRLTTLLCTGLFLLSFVTMAQAEECDPNDPTLLKPDLYGEPPTRPRALQRGAERNLFFVENLGNIGQGPLILKRGETISTAGPTVAWAIQEVRRTNGTTCTHTAGRMLFNPFTQQWQMDSLAEYQLRKNDPFTGAVVASSRFSPCILGLLRLRGFRTPAEIFGNCRNESDGAQGIAAGYAHVDENYFPHSSSDVFSGSHGINLDSDPEHPVPGGTYYLVVVPNPDGSILESDSTLESSAGVISVSVPSLRLVRSTLTRRQPTTPSNPLPQTPGTTRPRPTTRAPRAPHVPHTPR